MNSFPPNPPQDVITELRAGIEKMERVEFGYISGGVKELGDFRPLQHHPAPIQGEVVVTTDEDGRCVAVTRQDEEGRILSVIWEAKEPI